MILRECDDDITRFRLRFHLEQVGIGGHDAPVEDGARLIEMREVPVPARKASADVQQVGSGAHGAKLVGTIVDIIRGDRGPPPAALGIGCLLGATRLLAVAIYAPLLDIDLATAQLLLRIGLQARRSFERPDLRGWRNDQKHGREGQDTESKRGQGNNAVHDSTAGSGWYPVCGTQAGPRASRART